MPSCLSKFRLCVLARAGWSVCAVLAWLASLN